MNKKRSTIHRGTALIEPHVLGDLQAGWVGVRGVDQVVSAAGDIGPKRPFDTAGDDGRPFEVVKEQTLLVAVVGDGTDSSNSDDFADAKTERIVTCAESHVLLDRHDGGQGVSIEELLTDVFDPLGVIIDPNPVSGSVFKE